MLAKPVTDVFIGFILLSSRLGGRVAGSVAGKLKLNWAWQKRSDKVCKLEAEIQDMCLKISEHLSTLRKSIKYLMFWMKERCYWLHPTVKLRIKLGMSCAKLKLAQASYQIAYIMLRLPYIITFACWFNSSSWVGEGGGSWIKITKTTDDQWGHISLGIGESPRYYVSISCYYTCVLYKTDEH